MFTGIIQNIGTVTALDKGGDWVFEITTPMPLDNVALGASIACNGVCLTVIRKDSGKFCVQVSQETRDKTTASKWDIGTRLNLERALRVGDELGGHIVLGHIDGVARIVSKNSERDSIRYTFEVPQEFAKFLAPKGSIALDGISLTINAASNCRADINIIPHTQKETTFGNLSVGEEVNFEVDMMARYIDRMLNK